MEVCGQLWSGVLKKIGEHQTSFRCDGVRKIFCRDTNPGRPAHDDHSTSSQVRSWIHQVTRKRIQDSDGETFFESSHLDDGGDGIQDKLAVTQDRDKWRAIVLWVMRLGILPQNSSQYS
jgi:hypothetical protein